MITLFVLIILLPTIAFAGQKYNPYDGTWETVPDYWETKYNPYEGNWSHQPPDVDIEYNPYEGSWDWDSGHNPD